MEDKKKNDEGKDPKQKNVIIESQIALDNFFISLDILFQKLLDVKEGKKMKFENFIKKIKEKINAID